jgi:DNA-binding response OmpR family regulator
VKVLLIDDDQEILDAVTVGFQFEWPDCTVLTARDGQSAVRAFLENTPDFVVLDVTMPHMSGFDVLREIRLHSQVPVLFLTARQTDANVVRGLNLGADDYVQKPFSLIALLARIRAILRRTGVASSGPLTFADLTIDTDEQQVRAAGHRVQLTPTEFRLLEELARSPNRTLSNNVLCQRIWGPHWRATSNDLKALVHRLRVKISDDPRHPKYIENQRGIGYRFIARPE